MRELDVDERALTPAAGRAPDQPRQEPDARARGRGAARAHPSRGADRRALSAVRGQRLQAAGARRLRRPAAAGRAALRDGRPRRSPGTARVWTHVLVDEYQDTNRAQYRIVQLLTQEHRNLCVVGDPDQSIYRWRGADLRNILDFEKDYPDCRVVALEQNYRSTKRILDIASAVIAHNPARKEKRLWTDNARGRAGDASTGRGTRTRRRASWRSRSARCAARAWTTATSRSSTAPTRSRACWRTRCAGRASPT